MKSRNGLKESSEELPVIAVFGPTASGKTKVALDLAERLGGEIVSVDSGQIYRGLNIGTAKPMLEERSRAPFHLIDIVDPDHSFSAALFRTRALAAIDDIRSRGKRPILTVGTGLYFRSLEEGLFEGPSADIAVRAELEDRLREEGMASLEGELRRVDPEAARRIPKNNRQRLIRALEVFRLTGRPISEFWSGGKPTGISSFLFDKIGFDIPREELNRRIEERVEAMIEQGLLAEVRGLLAQWGAKAPGLRLIGYKEIIAYHLGKTSLEAAISLVVKNTRQYAKRQRTWFKKDKEISWFHTANEITQRLTKR